MKHQLFALFLLNILLFQKVTAQEVKTTFSTDSILALRSVTEGDVITLEWDSQRAVNIRVFIIERSIDGKPFELLTIMRADNRYPVNTHYSYKDPETLMEEGVKVQYRLKTIYMNGGQNQSTLDVVKDEAGMITSR